MRACAHTIRADTPPIKSLRAREVEEEIYLPHDNLLSVREREGETESLDLKAREWSPPLYPPQRKGSETAKLLSQEGRWLTKDPEEMSGHVGLCGKMGFDLSRHAKEGRTREYESSNNRRKPTVAVLKK